eukprot:Lithocolla_globosa_v1_NODE_1179_length_2806_cov_6.192294.p4 type:complete len:101 gc:universal NODE_1179_length_2806_cov_6.192294:2097-1795(-)
MLQLICWLISDERADRADQRDSEEWSSGQWPRSEERGVERGQIRSRRERRGEIRRRDQEINRKIEGNCGSDHTPEKSRSERPERFNRSGEMQEGSGSTRD